MVEVVAAIIRDRDKFLICQRPENKKRALMWEFPGGKIEAGETPEAALKRELMEELGIKAKPESMFFDTVYEYPDITVHITFYNTYIIGGEITQKEHHDIRWISADEVDLFTFCPADKGIIDKIVEKENKRREVLKNLTVECAKENDLDDILCLYTQLSPINDSSGDVHGVFGNILKNEGQYIILAKVNGKAVSSCALNIIQNLTHGARPYAVVENVVTEKEYRGFGLASACLDRARDIAKKHNCYKIMLMTGSKKESTLRFYEQAGYDRYSKTAMNQRL